MEETWKLNPHCTRGGNQVYDLIAGDRLELTYLISGNKRNLILFDTSGGEPRHLMGIIYEIGGRAVSLGRYQRRITKKEAEIFTSLKPLVEGSKGLPADEVKTVCGLLEWFGSSEYLM